MSNMDRQYNGQNKKDKRTNGDLRYTTQKSIDWQRQTPLRTRVNLGAPEGLAVPVHLG